ncbi:helix-turn-helix domain-containing protein [Luteibacter aegosomatis]|uniref:helix-turn-helix domain-containing protein n=1 Tax=Luteibacter aegosomatis TaxID=2911537 RepID=UPI001FFBC78F|nr:helix-turn-helix transcriptional regulator [Luteibacter aegosomatis]UPG84525.1 helix-turn-helix domain-containing protein [Luteibacter aegosomatis]
MPKSTSSPEHEAFCGWLVETRQGKGTTQVALAKALGVSQPYISHVEKGDVRVDPVQLYRWLRALGVDPVPWHTELYTRMDRAGKAARRKRQS